MLSEALRSESAKDYDLALKLISQAVAMDPQEPAYLIAEQRAKTLCSNWHLANGRQFLEIHKLEDALGQFKSALSADMSSTVALQMIEHTEELLREPLKSSSASGPSSSQQQLRQRVSLLQGAPTLEPLTGQITNLLMHNQTGRILYESVAKLAGINVIFDSQGIEGASGSNGARNFNLELREVTLEEALNYVALTTHTFWKPVSRNVIFVTSETEQKRLEYQDEVVRVFYVRNASTQNEFVEIFNGVRAGSKLANGVSQVSSQNAIIARGSPDTISIIEKLLYELDRPKAEVVVEVLIMEVQKSKVVNLGAALAGMTLGGGAATGFAVPITPGRTTIDSSAGSTPTTTGTTIPLSRVPRLSTNQFSVGLPSAVIEAFLSDSSSRLLERPEVRVTDGGKAILKVGQKIPYVSGSLNSAVATPGSIPYATTQFQQLDVGLNIDMQPHVNGPEDISMHVKVEVSSLASPVTIAGVQEPVISQKVNEADLRMRDGEVSLLGGLTQDSDTNAISGIPGFANMPVIGYLFGTRSKDREKDEIVIALIPHIVRTQMSTTADDGVLAGTERVVKVTRKLSAQ